MSVYFIFVEKGVLCLGFARGGDWSRPSWSFGLCRWWVCSDVALWVFFFFTACAVFPIGYIVHSCKMLFSLMPKASWIDLGTVYLANCMFTEHVYAFVSETGRDWGIAVFMCHISFNDGGSQLWHLLPDCVSLRWLAMYPQRSSRPQLSVQYDLLYVVVSY